jgi:hypothetical protein
MRPPSRRAWSSSRRDCDAFVDDVLVAAGIPILHIRWQRSYDTRALAEQIGGRLGIAAPIVAPLPEAAPAALDGLWHPSAPAPASPPAVASNIPPASIALSRRACGECQSELRESAKFCAQCGEVFAT